MADTAPGTGLANILGGIGDLASGAAPLISSITGRSAGPQSVTYVQAPPSNAGNSLLVFGGIAIVVILFILLMRN